MTIVRYIINNKKKMDKFRHNCVVSFEQTFYNHHQSIINLDEYESEPSTDSKQMSSDFKQKRTFKKIAFDNFCLPQHDNQYGEPMDEQLQQEDNRIEEENYQEKTKIYTSFRSKNQIQRERGNEIDEDKRVDEDDDDEVMDVEIDIGAQINKLKGKINKQSVSYLGLNQKFYDDLFQQYVLNNKSQVTVSNKDNNINDKMKTPIKKRNTPKERKTPVKKNKETKSKQNKKQEKIRNQFQNQLDLSQKQDQDQETILFNAAKYRYKYPNIVREIRILKKATNKITQFQSDQTAVVSNGPMYSKKRDEMKFRQQKRRELLKRRIIDLQI